LLGPATTRSSSLAARLMQLSPIPVEDNNSLTIVRISILVDARLKSWELVEARYWHRSVEP
jgi:hypothetical protein